MQGDGDGWIECEAGHKHWGRFGAAGLLLHHRRKGNSGFSVLLQHRAVWSHHGDTWGLPGGARDSHEDAEQAALREAVEESAVDVSQLEISDFLVDDHGLWSYTTVIAVATTELEVRPVSRESIAFRWVAVADVERLPLHPGFAATWPRLSGRLGGGISGTSAPDGSREPR